MKIQIQFLALLFCVIYNTTHAQNAQPISEQNKIWVNPALMSSNAGFSVHNQTGLNYNPYINSNIQYFNSAKKLGFAVLKNNDISEIKENAVKASIAKGFKYKGINLTLGAGLDYTKINAIGSFSRFSTGLNLKIKQFELAYARMPKSNFNALHETIFSENYIPSVSTFFSSYTFSLKNWTLKPSLYYSRMANFTQLQLQSIALYKGKWVFGLASSQFDPSNNTYSIILGCRTDVFEVNIIRQAIITNDANTTALYHVGFSYFLASNKEKSLERT